VQSSGPILTLAKIRPFLQANRLSALVAGCVHAEQHNLSEKERTRLNTKNLLKQLNSILESSNLQIEEESKN
jgi:hypothetical protein